MTILSLVWGILALLGLFVGMVPCLGSLNWINIPFSLVGLIISIVAVSKAPPDAKGGAIAGIVMCALGLVIGAIRLIMGGGLL